MEKTKKHTKDTKRPPEMNAEQLPLPFSVPAFDTGKKGKTTASAN